MAEKPVVPVNEEEPVVPKRRAQKAKADLPPKWSAAYKALALQGEVKE